MRGSISPIARTPGDQLPDRAGIAAPDLFLRLAERPCDPAPREALAVPEEDRALDRLGQGGDGLPQAVAGRRPCALAQPLAQPLEKPLEKPHHAEVALDPPPQVWVPGGEFPGRGMLTGLLPVEDLAQDPAECLLIASLPIAPF